MSGTNAHFSGVTLEIILPTGAKVVAEIEGDGINDPTVTVTWKPTATATPSPIGFTAHWWDEEDT